MLDSNFSGRLGEEAAQGVGTVGRIDSAALARGLGAVAKNRVVSLARPGASGRSARGDMLPALSIERFEETKGEFLIRTEHLQIDCHGTLNTHIDALNHIVGTDGDPSERDSVASWARTGIVTRGFLADIPRHRGQDWVDVTEPVSGDELELVMGTSSVPFLRGDALFVYMGRNRYEDAGNVYLGSAETESRPGLSRSGGEWACDHGASVLGWDFLDSKSEAEQQLGVHRLINERGLVLIDNCDLSVAALVAQELGKVDGLLVVAPLRIQGLSGSIVNPLMVF